MNVSFVRSIPGEVTIRIEGEITLSGTMEKLNRDYEAVYAAIRTLEGVNADDVDGQSGQRLHTI